MGKFRSFIVSFFRFVRSLFEQAADCQLATFQAVSERLEDRMMFSFTASLSAPQSVVAGAPYSVNLSTSGGVAAKWIVNWGDGLPAITYLPPQGGFGVQYQTPSHPYTNQSSYVITATADTAANVTAVAAMTLNNNFGSYNFIGSGKTSYPPYGSTGDSKGQAMIVDHFSDSPYYGYIYVASNYNSDPNNVGQRMAVTRFTPQGNIDNT